MTQQKRLFTQGLLVQLQSLGSVIAYGLPSYLIISQAGKQLVPEEFSFFVIFWTLLNTVLLASFSSLEAQGPYFASQMEGYGALARKIRSLSMYAGFFSLGVILLSLLGLGRFTLINTSLSLLCVAAYALWNAKRTLLLGSHKMLSILRGSVIFALISSFLLALFSRLGSSSALTFILILPIAWVFSTVLVELPIGKGKTVASIRETQEITKLNRNDLERYFLLSTSTFFGLMPGAVSLILATIIFQDPNVFSSFVGVILLTRLGLTLINSVTPTFLITYSKIDFGSNEHRKLLMAHNLFFVLGAFIAGAIFLVAGDRLLQLFLATEMALNNTEIVLLVIGETVFAATVSTKTLLISRGTKEGHLYPWIIGSLVYFAIIYVTRSVIGFGLAGIMTGVVIFFLQARALNNRASSS